MVDSRVAKLVGCLVRDIVLNGQEDSDILGGI